MKSLIGLGFGNKPTTSLVGLIFLTLFLGCKVRDESKVKWIDSSTYELKDAILATGEELGLRFQTCAYFVIDKNSKEQKVFLLKTGQLISKQGSIANSAASLDCVTDNGTVKVNNITRYFPNDDLYFEATVEAISDHLIVDRVPVGQIHRSGTHFAFISDLCVKEFTKSCKFETSSGKISIIPPPQSTQP